MCYSTTHSITKKPEEIKENQGFSPPKAAGPQAPLVRNTKSDARQVEQSPAVPGFEGLQNFLNGLHNTEHRLRRYFIQHLAVSTLFWEAGLIMGNDPKTIEQRRKHHRTISCMRSMLSDVKIHTSIDHGKAFYSGLMACGSVWACPVCAAKIQARRTIEVAKLYDWAYRTIEENGSKRPAHQILMLTLTFPHAMGDDINATMEKFAKALKAFRTFNNTNSVNGFKTFKEKHGFTGLVRSLEITFGQNGWHPHTHELWILDHWAEDPDREEHIRQYLLNRWETACKKAGLLEDGKIKAFRENSIKIEFRTTSTDYLNKQNKDADQNWGADKEIANASTKLGRSHGKTPFQLLTAAEENPDKKDYYRRLFLEYVHALEGKPQLFWSHGLKAKVGVLEKTDEELIAEETDKADLLAVLNRSHWSVVIKSEGRAELLDLAEQKGFDGVAAWFAIRGLKLDKPTAQQIEAEQIAQIARQQKLAEKVERRVERKKLGSLKDQIKVADRLAEAKNYEERLAIIKRFLGGGSSDES